jgi:tetratricopeptide (TPR) repeat protein
MSVRKWFDIKEEREEKKEEEDPASIFNAALNLHESGRFQDAYPLYLKALEGFETFLKTGPANILFQSDVAKTQNNLGNLLRDMGRLEEAETRFELALELHEKLLNSDTANTLFQSDVAGTQNNLGNLLWSMRRLEEAKTRYERALELHEKLLNSDPANSQFQSDVAGTQNNLGLLLTVMGRLEEAKTRFELALKMREKLLKSDPANTRFPSHVATTQNNLGILLSIMGRQEEAKTRYEQALELVKEQKNQHDTGRSLALLGILELKRDDPETARAFLESSIEKLNKDIRPHYPNALNLLALCYFKLGERKKKEARREKRRENARRQVSESSQFFSLAAGRYREAYELPYARMPVELLIDACLADAFASSVQTVSEEDDQQAVELLNESIEKLEKALEPAKKNEGQRKRVEGVRYDLLAKRCIRSVSLFKGEKGKKKQEELLVEASDNLLRAARNFEELESDKTAASCQGCACLYRGLKKFKDGFLSDKFKLIAEAHGEFKNAASFYKNAESEVGEDVISTINEVMSEMEGSYDKWEGRKPGIADYLSISDKISNLIEQVSAIGLKNLFKVYVFDVFMNLMDERKMKIKEGNVYAGEVVMEKTVFENIQNSTIINKSVVENSFNKIRAEQGEEVASALKEIAEFIERSGNREAGELFDRFNEELNKPEPKKSVLKSVWAGIEKAIPVATALAEPVAKLAMLFK